MNANAHRQTTKFKEIFKKTFANATKFIIINRIVVNMYADFDRQQVLTQISTCQYITKYMIIRANTLVY